MPDERSPRPRVLFLCTGNSCRSQMAEGWARALLGERIEAHSAGTAPGGLNPLAVRVMAEAGVDISRARSKSLAEFASRPLDLVVTVCDHARENCPLPPPTTALVHRGFEDPPALAAALRDEAAILECYRRIRDAIRMFVAEELPRLIEAGVRAR